MTRSSAERARAARLLERVVGGRSTDALFADQAPTPLVRELVLGSLRHYFSLDAAVFAALRRPLRKKDQDVRCLMIVGVYQLWHLRVPDHAAIFETVSACRDLRKPWARALVNAVLRQCSAPPAVPQDDASERSFEHPPWLQTILRREYADAEALMAANNQRAPMALRVNTLRIPPGAYRERLGDAGLEVRAPRAAAQPVSTFGPETMILTQPVPVAELPGHADGLVSVQDAGAQLAAGLLRPSPGDRVIDACAAPGGKAFHVFERCPGARFTALERQPQRLDAMRAEAARLGHERVELVPGDATCRDWWDGIPAEHVLLDAPCSGTGTLRRHPDIKLHRRASDVSAAAELQRQLLANLWQVLAPGGTLLYCTCSILAAENDDVIDDFLARHDDAVNDPFVLPSGRPTTHGWQLLPTDPDTDGFYFARMIRATP